MNPAAVQAAYRRALAGAGPGETATFVRQGDATVYQAAAYVPPASANAELAGGMVQNKRRAIVLADDLAASGFPLPLRVNADRFKWGSDPTSNAVKAVAERRVQGVTVAYELDLEGA
jgi:hypothetical protein